MERHRLLYLRCIATGHLSGKGTLLHFAPEPIFRTLLKERTEDYVTAGLDGVGVDRQLNIERIDLESAQIDTVICNHVLEHVDDAKALREIHRILKPGGVLYCMVPIVEGWSETYENAAICDAAGRTLHFGQNDHVRFYGRDFRDRLRGAGFALEEFSASGEEVVKYGLMPGETVFVCRKPAP